MKQLRAMMVILGCNMDPHQAFLVSRGVKTLSLRVERAQAERDARLPRWLEAHPKVEWVRYIGLPSHPQHELVKRQMSGFGSMISFELKGGFEAGRRLMDSVKLATLAVSLGGVETLIEHPASMTHAGMSEADRLEGGITAGLVRYSVGIEDVEDLIADLSRPWTGSILSLESRAEAVLLPKMHGGSVTEEAGCLDSSEGQAFRPVLCRQFLSRSYVIPAFSTLSFRPRPAASPPAAVFSTAAFRASITTTLFLPRTSKRRPPLTYTAVVSSMPTPTTSGWSSTALTSRLLRCRLRKC